MVVNAHNGYYTGRIFLDGVDVSSVCFMADDTPGEDGRGTVILFVTKEDYRPCPPSPPFDVQPYIPPKENGFWTRLCFEHIGIGISSPVLMVQHGHVVIEPGEHKPRKVPR